MGLVASSCMSSSAISSAIFAPTNKKKKHREVLPHSSSAYPSCDEKQSPPFCKVPRRKDKTISKSLSPLRIDTIDENDDLQKPEFDRRFMVEDLSQSSSLDSKNFLESADRELIVSYSYSEGISRQYTLHDDPTYFIGWEVHIEGEGVGFILSCLGPFFSGVRFEVQLQDGRILIVPFSQGGSVIDSSEEMSITFLQRIF